MSTNKQDPSAIAAVKQGDASFDAVRRFWCSREPGPAEDFIAPVGTVAITLDIANAAPVTCLINAAKITDIMTQISKFSATMSYYSIVRLLVDMFLAASRSDADLTWIGLGAAWTALHHPKSGSVMRTKVATALRKDGKAHISWRFDPTAGLFMALAEGFVDLEKLASHAPRDQLTMVVNADPDDGEPSN